ncbi:hypothetical protein [Bradyrhizobium prioriisuperbiae]|uniref:hypothetical protein n=1 Tax=Bradyrhizobium prioriisuperbiae TaxID=2854389 RepID=UPI0028ED64B5|nr:hypothetical protein [Bradyrhizobium prioritasuperba]
MPTRSVVRTDVGKLKALRAAARLGADALDRGEFKEFKNAEDLQIYLNDVSEKVISATAQARGGLAK